ncbi:hypothetical protein B4135_2072 [Caldibacillus debilis]|uniref:Uncharacterized protein n=1 Tax=Caldibacillus debilis TaxID=301148 RepID=A0A150M4P9_9BACI|nr:hypothetical protein B4135_2072 [Caldibacillus debilis]
MLQNCVNLFYLNVVGYKGDEYKESRVSTYVLFERSGI